MTQLTKAEFDIQTVVLFPTNGVGAISALDLRTQINNISDSVPFKRTGNASAPTADDDVDNNSGNGAVEIGDIWIDETNDQAYVCVDNTAFNAVWLGITSGGLGSSVVPYDFNFRFSSTPTSSQYINKFMVPRQVTFGADLIDSYGYIGTNPTSSFVMEIGIVDPEAFAPFGTVTIDTFGAFTFTTTNGFAILVNPGTLIGLRAPAIVDATAADMTVVIAASTPSL